MEVAVSKELMRTDQLEQSEKSRGDALSVREKISYLLFRNIWKWVEHVALMSKDRQWGGIMLGIFAFRGNSLWS